MGIDRVSEKRITLHLSVDDLRLIRGALSFGQVNKARPFSFDQDLRASEIKRLIGRELERLR